MSKFYQHTAPKDGSLCHHSKLIPEVIEDGINDLYCLCEVVKNTHFAYIKDEFLLEDMEGAALVKMLEFLKSGTFDPDRGSLKNILYTICRNEMKNCIYRSSRSTPVEEEVMAINESPQIQVSTSKIEFTDEQFKGLRLTDEYIRKIKSSLNNMGFITDEEDYQYYDEVERWVSMVIWRKLS